MILIADDGNGAPDHIHLTPGLPSLEIPPLPYAQAGQFKENQIMKLGPTRLMSCKEDTNECWTLNLGDNTWVKAADMLLRHYYNECHLDFGSMIMLFGGGRK